ncbi:MAG: von Willebrand factor type A domain-containing protein, partial [candidate division Zixibacteria bacterium]|nr:von Willebrand factor type A domain-containing protein [candidate division Zixibacteria bacterium]
MHTNKLLPHMILTSILLMITLILNAAEIGKIKGIVTDSQTGNPIIGASVFIVGTSISTKTDFDGKYIIRDIKQGKYNLKVTHVDYNSVTIQGIEIKADISVIQNIFLTQKTNKLDVETKTTAEKEIIPQIKDELNSVLIPKQKTNKKIMRAPTTVSQFYVGCSQNDHTGGFPPAHGGTAIVNGEPFDAMFFENYGTNPFVDVEDDSLSTFAIDVDDASYIMSRSYLERGYLPPKDAVRS